MIIRHDRRDRESMVDPCKWPAITSFFHGNGAASLVAPTWLLTAAHIANYIPKFPVTRVDVGGRNFSIARILLYPGYDQVWKSLDTNDNTNVVDLALVELKTPVKHVAPYRLYTGSDEVGQELLLLGSGQRGDGLAGVKGNDGQLRHATNIVDETDDYWLKFRFDEPPDTTELEGVGGNGDSGGPAFIQKNGEYLIAGVSSWQDNKGKPLGSYGSVEHYTRVSRFVEWIQSIILEEPTHKAAIVANLQRHAQEILEENKIEQERLSNLPLL